MSEINVHEDLRLFLIIGLVLGGVGTFIYAYDRTNDLRRPKLAYGGVILLCGIALCGLMTIILSRIDAAIIDRQARAISVMQNSLWLSEEKAKGPLTDNNLLILSTAIKPFAGTEYDLVATSCAEPAVVNKLNAAISDGQWKSVGANALHETTAAAISDARSIRIQYSRASHTNDAVSTLRSALAGIGFNVTVDATDTRSADLKPNVVHISIGADSQ